MCLLTQTGDACNALAGPLTNRLGPLRAAVCVVMRLAGLPRNGALALNLPPQSWKGYLSSTSCEADSLRGVGGCFGGLLGVVGRADWSRGPYAAPTPVETC